MAPATTVELYWATAAGHTPTRWTAWRAWIAWLHVVKPARFGMATGGGPEEMTAEIVDPCFSLTALPPERGWGCWLTISPAPMGML